MLKPVDILQILSENGYNRTLITQTGYLIARHIPDAYREINDFINGIPYPQGGVANTGNENISKGVTFNQEDFQKKSIFPTASLANNKSNFHSGIAPDPIPPVNPTQSVFETIEQAYEYYKVSNKKDLISEIKKVEGVSIHKSANENQILNVLNSNVASPDAETKEDDSTIDQE